MKGKRVHEVGAVGTLEHAEEHAAGDIVAWHPPHPGDDVACAKVKACPAIIVSGGSKVCIGGSVEGFI